MKLGKRISAYLLMWHIALTVRAVPDADILVRWYSDHLWFGPALIFILVSLINIFDALDERGK